MTEFFVQVAVALAPSFFLFLFSLVILSWVRLLVDVISGDRWT